MKSPSLVLRRKTNRFRCKRSIDSSLFVDTFKSPLVSITVGSGTHCINEVFNNAQFVAPGPDVGVAVTRLVPADCSAARSILHQLIATVSMSPALPLTHSLTVSPPENTLKHRTKHTNLSFGNCMNEIKNISRFIKIVRKCRSLR